MQGMTYNLIRAKSPILAQTMFRDRLVTAQSGFLFLWLKDGNEYLPAAQLRVDTDVDNDSLVQQAKNF